MDVLISTKRQDDIISKELKQTVNHVIGGGGSGSNVVEVFARAQIGQKGLHIYDGDKVESHNPTSQKFTSEHINRFKVNALAEQVQAWSGGKVPAHPHRYYVKKHTPFNGNVFLCIDDMRDRWDILVHSLWDNTHVPFVAETRMDASTVQVFVFDPNCKAHRILWERYYYPDSEADNEAGCNGPQSVLTATQQTATIAVQQLINYYRNGQDMESVAGRIGINLRTWELTRTPWPMKLDQ